MTDLPPELLAAILAEPDDDTPRLVAADWLDESGDAEHARLIRVECRLYGDSGRGASLGERRRLNAEVAVLHDRLVARWRPWLGPLGNPALARLATRRGFLGEVSCDRPPQPATLAYLRHAPLLESLVAPALTLDRAAFERIRVLTNLRHLAVRRVLPADAEAMVRLLASLTRLATALVLEPPSREWARELELARRAERARLPAAERVVCERARIRPFAPLERAGVRVWALRPPYPECRDLPDGMPLPNVLTVERSIAPEHLPRGGDLPGLLALTGRAIADAPANAFERLTGLRNLSLALLAPPTPGAIESLVARRTSLTALSLEDAPASAVELAALLAPLRGLRALTLRGVPFGPGLVPALRSLPELRELRLNVPRLPADALAEILRLPGLTFAEVRGHALSGAELDAVGAASRLPLLAERPGDRLLDFFGGAPDLATWAAGRLAPPVSVGGAAFRPPAELGEVPAEGCRRWLERGRDFAERAWDEHGPAWLELREEPVAADADAPAWLAERIVPLDPSVPVEPAWSGTTGGVLATEPAGIETRLHAAWLADGRALHARAGFGSARPPTWHALLLASVGSIGVG